MMRTPIFSAVMTALGGFLFLGAVVYSSYKVGQATKRVQKLNDSAEVLTVQIAQRESTLKRITPVAAKGLGYVRPDTITSSSALSASLSASYAAKSLAKSGIARRRGTTVRYYPRGFEQSVNRDIVLPVLRNAGFTLVERQTAGGMRDLGTNAIWFGADIPIEDVKLVALVLASAGAQIRAIRRFRDPTGPKRRAIEIGADRQEVSSPVWTPERIVEARDFPRDR